jgi:hypothetical protein
VRWWSMTNTLLIQKINLQIIDLMLKRRQTQKYGTWEDEQAITDQIKELEKQIKAKGDQ